MTDPMGRRSPCCKALTAARWAMTGPRDRRSHRTKVSRNPHRCPLGRGVCSHRPATGVRLGLGHARLELGLQVESSGEELVLPILLDHGQVDGILQAIRRAYGQQLQGLLCWQDLAKQLLDWERHC